MDEGTLKHKLRDLRRVERRIRGSDATPTFDRYFATGGNARVRYPLGILRVLDHQSRARAFREYYLELFRDASDPTRRVDPLLAMLGLPDDATDDMVRRAFRTMAREIHPDTGGDDKLMSELIEHYQTWCRERDQ